MKLVIGDEADMLALGGRLARACPAAAVIYLHGQLGAGKTTLARGFLRARGYGGAVKSPTYTLIEPYEVGDRRVYHLDLYRVEDAAELAYLGLRELYEGKAVMLVEWPERGGTYLPPPDLVMEIEYATAGRQLLLVPHSAIGEALISALGSDFSPD